MRFLHGSPLQFASGNALKGMNAFFMHA